MVGVLVQFLVEQELIHLRGNVSHRVMHVKGQAQEQRNAIHIIAQVYISYVICHTYVVDTKLENLQEKKLKPLHLLVNCQWDLWSTWSSCSSSCGKATHTRYY